MRLNRIDLAEMEQLRAANAFLKAELAAMKAQRDEALDKLTAIRAVCVGYGRSSRRGDVEDVADLKAQRDEAVRLAASLDVDCRNYGVPAPAIGCESDCHPCEVMRALLALSKVTP